MDTLTHEDVAILTRHFAPGEHEFLRGFTYISESAVTARLDEVDPAWSWIIVDEHPRDNQSIVKGRLTVKGVTREGVGMQPLTITSSKTGEILEGTEPEKSAATDALKRAARLFGIGRYLLDLPTGTNNIGALTAWLKQQSGNPNGTRPTPPPPQNSSTSLTTGSKDETTHDSSSETDDEPFVLRANWIIPHETKDGKVFYETEGGATTYSRELFHQKAGYTEQDTALWPTQLDRRIDLFAPLDIFYKTVMSKGREYKRIVDIKKIEPEAF